MIKANPGIVKEMKRYDPALYVKYNNRDSLFEVWRKMPWGERLITPVTQIIFNPDNSDGINKFCQLDGRIMKWLYHADPHRKEVKNCQSIKYRCDQAKRGYAKKEYLENKKSREQYESYLREEYYILNDPKSMDLEESDFIRPDVTPNTRSGHIMRRSGANAKKYFEAGGD